MEAQTSFSNFLRNELENRKQLNARYSLRAFARSLGLSPSYLSKLMTGKRAVSDETFLQITSTLKIGDQHLNALAETRAFKPVDQKFESIQVDHFRTIADWHHYAILEAATLPDFQAKPKWIAERLSISEERAKSGLERLIRLSYLKLDKNGKVSTPINNYSSLSDLGISQAQTEHERQVLDGAIEALRKVPLSNRSQSSVTMAIPASRIDEAKEKIKKFRRELMSSLQRRGKRDSIYQLSISFYPITQIKDKK
jgi:uncharacterized protein (TIGR02147 family)